MNTFRFEELEKKVAAFKQQNPSSPVLPVFIEGMMSEFERLYRDYNDACQVIDAKDTLMCDEGK